MIYSAFTEPVRCHLSVWSMSLSFFPRYLSWDNTTALYAKLLLSFVEIKASLNWFLDSFLRFRIRRQVKTVNFSITMQIWRFGRPGVRTCQTTDVLCVAQNRPHEAGLPNPACKWIHTETPKGFPIFFHVYRARCTKLELWFITVRK